MSALPICCPSAKRGSLLAMLRVRLRSSTPKSLRCARSPRSRAIALCGLSAAALTLIAQ